ncbi:MAG: hypothetical protein JXA04_11155 [Gammaproteobacteria bacterium]|nr:hypothetical protein [Gammaproteobacteria bacterium]
MQKLKIILFGVIIGLLIGLWFGVNIGKHKPIYSNPFAEPSTRDLIRQTGGKLIEKGGRAIEKSGEAIRGTDQK